MAQPLSLPRDVHHPATARVDLSRLDANYRKVAAASPVPLMPVLKANAYGHGALVVARRFEALGAPLLAVAYPEEGVFLRREGIRSEILVLAGFDPGEESLPFSEGLTPVVSTPGSLESLLRSGGPERYPVHLKVDTGMGRLGFSFEALEALLPRILASGRLDIQGLMTHLAVADCDAAATKAQLDLFDRALLALERRGIAPRFVHAANSAGIAHSRPTHTLARPGLLLYGLRPRPLSPLVDVEPVMSVRARIRMVKEVPEGTKISYGHLFVARHPTRIATVPLGYADGVPRTDAMRERGFLMVKGRKAPIAGSVCMDLVMADVTGIEAEEGDEAVLFGDEPTAWDLSLLAGTNAWDILTGVGSRIPRVYVDEARGA